MVMAARQINCDHPSGVSEFLLVFGDNLYFLLSFCHFFWSLLYFVIYHFVLFNLYFVHLYFSILCFVAVVFCCLVVFIKLCLSN